MIVTAVDRHEQRPLRDREPSVDADPDEVTVVLDPVLKVAAVAGVVHSGR